MRVLLGRKKESSWVFDSLLAEKTHVARTLSDICHAGSHLMTFGI